MIDLDPGEKVVLKVRRHKLSFVFEILFLVFFVALPPFLFWVSENTTAIKGNDFALFSAIYSTILLIAWIIFFIIWTNYYLDVLIVTEKRIINVEQKGFFNREAATLRLDKIQDISINVSGILATFLNFGTLKIQSAGEAPEFIIRDIPDPNKVKMTIYDLYNKQAGIAQPVSINQ
ncbi:MAG: hypothetical protein A3B91_04955 [Candidatus Yanofskybacteria bacterium RIFCSPHIGHO2_02_FULL_41_29]|uniref:YdbS-like PH domain-containing protein n=1 Tax=Candidatus Yanofskybacteria bacterium RIFCSPHIGHO2_01_FULL_41_53 TaxID=1802663 RepID=A0A1F8EIT5_9BACT|nr:MAG: hypothetical protein A2650_01565 [Candidatus Yanofskybacteria bacterium RIFCSPHIGHO2_01_FULL_41_53]OGN11168.1 MAG: hypothetical protein A3B91_04955 [Candidatus Yanofskybacteria bacterium RIFCSPHIGHO2_02_FULL_41_29]OGN16834.1 MAG: hypothetical protein A3F48_04255 [Candidatus Yanofskybacteria bacterium RIFCSPHIGHO2_12_FULL_41_9]OGN22082.1 MAG: hypothetical protein A2916_00175 [Candidatus Yanofskybacteria bacterium RIFCSPLOWO2_01_FULL_41_67]OGN28535.1 MAG: hypothetical protein A3H54_04735 